MPRPDQVDSRCRYRLGVMGGTFDPIHLGHLAAASEVLSSFKLDEVVFVPALPSHKPGRSVAPAEERYTMVVLAVASNPKFTASRVDIDRGRPTYTVDTLRDLAAERGEGTELFFITGADVIAEIGEWENSEGIFDLAHFIGVTRHGHELSTGHLPEGGTSTCVVPALAVSSTDIRERVASNRPIYYLVPDSVLTHIGKAGLYGADWGYVRRG